MYCRKYDKGVNEKACLKCWRSGQRGKWRRRMLEELGKPINLLRRFCRIENLYDKKEDAPDKPYYGGYR